MINAESFIRSAGERGFRLYSGVPCSYLTPFINYVLDSSDLRYIGAANEGDAVALVAGAQLGGVRGVTMHQNSGLGNALNPLTSLTHTFRIPLLVITTLRAEPGGPKDEPQHHLMGAITTSLLELMEIPWEYFPDEPEQIDPCLERAVAHMDSEGRPYALVMRKGTVEPWELGSTQDAKQLGAQVPPSLGATHSRRELLEAIHDATGDEDVLVATTGYTGRELYAVGDRDNQIYMVGSMGCASSLGLGLAITQPDRRIVVLDGDGAALMRLGAEATLGFERPPNLVHILFDNGMHESTGGQATVSGSLDFCAIAAGCGYPRTSRVSTPAELGDLLEEDGDGLHFIHVPTSPGVPGALPRPSLKPHEVAQRLRSFLGTAS
ncbi:MAG: phosphonopyruvate decarboxylase [Longimicrobiales bacterium]|nr:phosphonopyruvate decarboxylase [Longimicrobiales bacterium]